MSLPERWLVVRARDAGVDDDDGRVAEALLDIGGRAAHFEDGWWITHLPDGDVEHADPERWRAQVAERLGSDAIEVEVAWQEHGDWAELWKRGLEPRRVGRHWVVTPSWCTPEVGPGDRVIVLDPGMAFGNAEHGTTRGCLRLLEAVVQPGERLLDVGAGSAVLSIAAALLGAASVTAIEFDPLATPAARENAEANGVADRVEVVEARATVASLAALRPRDGVVANIERGILTPLLPGFHAALAPRGWLILSGIPADEWPAMAETARDAGFALEAVDADGEWCSGRFTRVD